MRGSHSGWFSVEGHQWQPMTASFWHLRQWDSMVTLPQQIHRLRQRHLIDAIKYLRVNLSRHEVKARRVQFGITEMLTQVAHVADARLHIIVTVYRVFISVDGQIDCILHRVAGNTD